MNDETYSVELTFREWMTVCHALGHAESTYRMKGIEGQANKFEAIQEQIVDGVNDD